MKITNKLAVGITALLVASQTLAAGITFYEGNDFRGRVFNTERPVTNLKSYGFNDRASSVIVDSGQWEVCEDAEFRGRCSLLSRGSYDSLQRMGLGDRISSVRRADGNRRYDYQPAQPLPAPTYEYRRRPNERLYEARVTSVHAVVGPPEQRCWIDKETVTEPRRSGSNVGGAIAGAIIGGVLGHQVGGGRGKDIATAGGAVVGGAIGANVGRNNTTTYDRDVQRCETIPSTTADYWDVTYTYRGVQHRTQMSSPPGATVQVNRNGEPRM